MLKGWLGGSGVASHAKHSASTQSLSALDEPQSLEQALKAMDLLMDDAVTAAEQSLEDGNSSYHKLAGGVIAFLRASLGFEQEVMKEASERLADAEASAERDRKRVSKNHAHPGKIPPGLEFAVCVAEAQLMSAVVGLLSESVVETMRSFYKLRTAYKSLESIHNTIEGLKLDEKRSRPPTAASTAASRASISSRAEDKPLELKRTGTAKSQARLETDTIEAFTTSGTNVCFGILLLLLGIIPPTLAKVMSIVGFRGDRDRGLELLWKATKAENVHGAIATLTILQYYGNTMQFCDIVPNNNQPGGYPIAQCEEILARVRRRYPHSALWRLEQARLEAVHGRLETAVDMLGQPLQTEMRQVEALILFEKSINSMFLHRYDDAAAGFLHLVTLNKWSHGLYHYFAAVCNVESYRLAARNNDAEKTKHYAKVATELLEKVPTFMGKKRFMAQSLPLEVFADRKIKKWSANAAATGKPLVDSVGVSPIEEMVYVWNGYKRIEMVDLERSWQALKWGEGEADEELDETAARELLRTVVLRRMGKLAEADETLKKVLSVEKVQLKGPHHDEWMVPAAYYEKAVLLWTEHGPTQKLDEMRMWLTKASQWGPYELDTRLGMKIQTALDTLQRITPA